MKASSIDHGHSLFRIEMFYKDKKRIEGFIVWFLTILTLIIGLHYAGQLMESIVMKLYEFVVQKNQVYL